MFKVMVPSNWSSGDGRLILRLVDRKTRKSNSLSITKGISRNIDLTDLPNKAPGEVVAWIDLNNNGTTTPLTNRVNLASLGKLKNLRAIIHDKSMTGSRRAELENIAEIANACRWIEPDDLRNIYAISQGIINRLQAMDHTSESNINYIFNVMNNWYTLNDGAEISNQIVYIWSLCQVNSALREGSKAGTFHAAQLRGSSESGRTLTAARSLLHQLKSFSELPAPTVVAASLESIVHGRENAERSYLDVLSTHRVSISRTGALGGVTSFGTLGSRQPIEIPELRMIGIGGRNTSSREPGRATVLYSADPRFLRAYLTRLVYYVGLFHEYDYHFHLIGNEAECRELTELIKSTYETNQTIRNQPTCSDHLSFSYSEVPEHVPDRFSYYASARFLVAGQLMKISKSPIWIQDVDLFPTGDSVRYLDELVKHDVALFVSPFLYGAFPWIRYLAGNVYINNTEQGFRFLDAASAYLAEWLLVKDSWTVDQNALSYAVEACGPDLDIADVREMGLPFQQSNLAARIES